MHIVLTGFMAAGKTAVGRKLARRLGREFIDSDRLMSNVLAFLYPQSIRKIGILAGFVPAGLEEYASKHPLEGKSVFVTHGTLDEMVPIDRARSSMDVLEQAGAKIVYCEDDVGHKVSLNCMHALRSYLED